MWNAKQDGDGGATHEYCISDNIDDVLAVYKIKFLMIIDSKLKSQLFTKTNLSNIIANGINIIIDIYTAPKLHWLRCKLREITFNSEM